MSLFILILKSLEVIDYIEHFTLFLLKVVNIPEFSMHFIYLVNLMRILVIKQPRTKLWALSCKHLIVGIIRYKIYVLKSLHVVSFVFVQF